MGSFSPQLLEGLMLAMGPTLAAGAAKSGDQGGVAVSRQHTLDVGFHDLFLEVGQRQVCCHLRVTDMS